jgi:acetate---CoA ligase (ADP-forming)
VRQDPSMTIRGFLVEEYAPGLEMILGITKDSTFGPMVLVGAGGVYAEALDDVSLGVAPLSGDQALRLIQSLKGYRLLRGLRGSPVADEEALARLLAELSQVAVAYAGVIDEVDVNPLIFSGGRWYAADALVRLGPASPGTRPGSSRAAGLVSP